MWLHARAATLQMHVFAYYQTESGGTLSKDEEETVLDTLALFLLFGAGLQEKPTSLKKEGQQVCMHTSYLCQPSAVLI